MRVLTSLLARLGVTAVAIVIAGGVALQLWTYYMDKPWTRDGRVRADIVGVAPDVSGLVSEVAVHDNQKVNKGQLLFRIDRARFELALRQAEAVVASRKAALVEAVRENSRYSQLNAISVSQEKQQQMQAMQDQAGASYQQALADRDLTQLNLQRADVTAPVDGTITNFDLQPGNYVSAGRAVTALVDAQSLWVEGYFEETKLGAIRVGAPVSIQLMGDRRELHGHVESSAAAIVDRERGENSNLLADVNPTFSWIRLARRVPVRVTLDALPAGLQLVPGRTATVVVEPEAGSLQPSPFALISQLLGSWRNWRAEG